MRPSKSIKRTIILNCLRSQTIKNKYCSTQSDPATKIKSPGSPCLQFAVAVCFFLVTLSCCHLQILLSLRERRRQTSAVLQ